jgi:hypothetical protein
MPIPMCIRATNRRLTHLTRYIYSIFVGFQECGPLLKHIKKGESLGHDPEGDDGARVQCDGESLCVREIIQ